jgi:hypothetical protein
MNKNVWRGAATVLGIIGGYLLASASRLFGDLAWLNAIAAKPAQGACGLLLVTTGCLAYRASSWS